MIKEGLLETHGEVTPWEKPLKSDSLPRVTLQATGKTFTLHGKAKGTVEIKPLQLISGRYPASNPVRYLLSTAIGRKAGCRLF
jgi:hypothetical protein